MISPSCESDVHRFPAKDDDAGWDRLSSGFQSLCTFPNAVGAIDGSFIRIVPGAVVVAGAKLFRGHNVALSCC